jgi:hypothetical protein
MVCRRQETLNNYFNAKIEIVIVDEWSTFSVGIIVFCKIDKLNIHKNTSPGT